MANKFSVKLIFSDTSITYDKNSGLDNIALHTEATADNTMPTYDVVSKSGSIAFYDFEDRLLSKIQARQYPTEIEIYKDDELFGKYISTLKYKYDIFTKLVTIELQGDIVKWQAITVEKKDITYDVTAYNVLEWLISKQSIVASISYLVISDNTVSWLQSITIPYFYLESATLWEQFNKLCNLAQLRIYQDKYNKVVIERYR